ncbi:MAG TPA: ATP-binding protein, partial [Saprospiraceae bacterium]|nr:ATP-binding protein [Saprospiraceae bacterium]
DPEKYSIMLSNLLSNAIKFSPQDEQIYVSLAKRKGPSGEQLEIKVKDNGIGIPQEELQLIFERFYQVNNELSITGIGTGVGLSLTKELVQLHGGEIEVSSVQGKGTQFTILLPLHHNAALKTEATSLYLRPELSTDEVFRATSDKRDADSNGEKPEILIIEDNSDVVRYLQICLGDLYQLTFCTNGELGVTEAINSVPALIISDVMMPVKDGLTACRELKLNPVTSHIPIILLSAKSDTASRIAGLKSGASAYLVKPFDKDELKAQVRTLLDQYKELHKRYEVSTTYENPEATIELVKEDEFVTRVRELIMDHLDDSDFSVNSLERGVFLSRSQLHKKLKALTGMSAMQFVSHIRLSKAREYLISNKESISDIAYQVGYSDPNYFSRAYSEHYGESPSETRNTLKARH